MKKKTKKKNGKKEGRRRKRSRVRDFFKAGRTNKRKKERTLK